MRRMCITLLLRRCSLPLKTSLLGKDLISKVESCFVGVLKHEPGITQLITINTTYKTVIIFFLMQQRRIIKTGTNMKGLSLSFMHDDQE